MSLSSPPKQGAWHVTQPAGQAKGASKRRAHSGLTSLSVGLAVTPVLELGFVAVEPLLSSKPACGRSSAQVHTCANGGYPQFNRAIGVQCTELACRTRGAGDGAPSPSRGLQTLD